MTWRPALSGPPFFCLFLCFRRESCGCRNRKKVKRTREVSDIAYKQENLICGVAIMLRSSNTHVPTLSVAISRKISRFVIGASFVFATVTTLNVSANADDDYPKIGTPPGEAAVKASFLKTKTEKHSHHVSFLALRFGGGLLDGGDYDKFAAFNNANITRTDGGTEVLSGLSNSYEIGLEMGTMLGDKSSVSLGLDYWLKNGSNNVGDFTLGVEPLGPHSGFELQSQITVIGASGNLGYFLLNKPSKAGVLKGLAIEAVGSAGFYFSKWQLWQGSGNINLSTGLFEQVGGDLTDQSPSFSGALRFTVPTNLFGTAIALEGGYQYLKFTNPSWKNALNEEISPTYSASSADKVELDFSGLRGKVAIRKFMSW